MIEKVTLTEALNNNVALIRDLVDNRHDSFISNVDVDNITNPGTYFLAENITNAQPYSFLLVFKSSTEISQFNYNANVTFLRIRNYRNGNWLDWVPIK